MTSRAHLASSTSRVTPSAAAGGRGDDLFLKVVDAALAGCIFVVPMLFGGRHPLGHLVLVALAVTAAAAWTVRQCLDRKASWRFSGVEILLAVGAALLVLQTVSLPSSLLEYIAPGTQEILPLWTAGDESSATLDTWSTISLTPSATRAGLVMFLAYSMLLVVTVGRIRAVEDVERLLRWVAISAVVIALFGLLQFFTSNGKFFWFYEHPFTDTLKVPKAAFANRNHFAHFLALGIGPLVWWLASTFRRQAADRESRFAESTTRRRSPELTNTLLVLALGVVLLAVLLSLSRGGAIVAALAAAISVAVCYKARLLGTRLALGIAATVLLIAACLTIFGHDMVSDRLGDLTAGSVEAVDRDAGRRTIWNAGLEAIGDHTALGTGAGSFREVAPIYLVSNDENTYYSHAENGYLQIALEAGLIGLALTLVGVGFCGFWSVAGLLAVGSRRTMICLGATIAALVASAAHSLVDFVWYCPACMATAVILAACTCRLRQLSLDGSEPARPPTRLPRTVAVAAAIAVLVVGGWMIANRVGPAVAQSHMTRVRLLKTSVPEPSPLDIRPQFGQDPQAQLSLGQEEKMKGELEEALRWDPDNARAHLELAACCLRIFDHHQKHSVNVMSLAEISDAAIRSQFPSKESLNDWLARAVGEHYGYLEQSLHHVRRALALCPLHGEAYLQLGDLCFLKGKDALAKSAYLSQAILVRPNNGTVLFHVGKEAWLAGDYDRWLHCWQKSFNCGQHHQRQMIDWIVGRTRPDGIDEQIEFFLKAFNPDAHTLRHLYHCYQHTAAPSETIALRLAYCRSLEDEAGKLGGKEAAGRWLEAADLHAEMANHAKALACAQAAAKCDATGFWARRRLGESLLAVGRFEEAEAELLWCLRRKPDNKTLESMYTAAVKGKDRQKILEVGKGDRHLLCEAPDGPFRQKEPVPLSRKGGRSTRDLLR